MRSGGWGSTPIPPPGNPTSSRLFCCTGWAFMRFMDRLSRLLGRLPDSLKTAANRHLHQSEHTATSSIEIVAADVGSSGQKGAEGLGDRNFVHPQPLDLISPHV